MRYHLVINGFLSEIQAQMEEMCGFAKGLPAEIEEGEALVILKTGEKILDGIPASEARVLYMETYMPVNALDVLCGWMTSEDLYIFGSDPSDIELAVRCGARKKGSSLAAVGKITVADGGLQASKMVYANHLKAAFLMQTGPYCISLERGMDKAKKDSGDIAVTEEANVGKPDFILEEEFIPEEKEKGLEQAKVVIAAGRGCGSKENVKRLEQTAESLGGVLGVSRPAAMNAWEPMDRLIGVSGAMLAPEICFAVGASGAAAFYAGIEKSKFIVAVNRDERAPIMKQADVAIADDFLPVMKRIEELSENLKRQ